LEISDNLDSFKSQQNIKIWITNLFIYEITKMTLFSLFLVQGPVEGSTLEQNLKTFPASLPYTRHTMGKYFESTSILAFESPHLDLN